MGSTELDLAQPALPGLAQPRAIRDLVDSFSMFDEGSDVVINRQPSQAEKSALTARLQAIGPSLISLGASDSTRKQAAALLAQFFMGYPSMLNADAPGLVTAYVADLMNVPLFALRQALDDIKHNRVMVRERGQQVPLDRNWAPPSTVVYDQAVKIMSGVNGEAIKIRRILGRTKLARPVVSEEERRIVAPRIRAMADQMIQRLQTTDPRDLEQLQKNEQMRRAQLLRQQQDFESNILEQYRRLGVDPVYANDQLVSPELAHKLNPQLFHEK